MATVTVNSILSITFSQVKGGYFATLSNSTIVPCPASFALFYASSGTGANQCDTFAVVELAFTGTNITENLSSGLVDVDGNPAVFVHVRTFAVKHQGTANGTPLIIGSAATHPWVGAWGTTITVLPSTVGSGSGNTNDGFTIFNAPNTTGYPVVAGTSDQILFNCGGATFNAAVFIAGTST